MKTIMLTVLSVPVLAGVVHSQTFFSIRPVDLGITGGTLAAPIAITETVSFDVSSRLGSASPITLTLSTGTLYAVSDFTWSLTAPDVGGNSNVVWTLSEQLDVRQSQGAIYSAGESHNFGFGGTVTTTSAGFTTTGVSIAPNDSNAGITYNSNGGGPNGSDAELWERDAQATFRAQVLNGGDNGANNYSFALAQPIPEPSSVLLCGLGILALGARRKRA